MNNDIEVVGLGALNVDHIYQVEHLLDDGESVVKDSMVTPGGSAANTIYGLAKLGVNTGFIGVIGDDDGGKMLLGDFQSVGVDTSQIKIKSQARTGSTLCLSEPSGRRSIYVLPQANNLLTFDDLDLSYINQSKIVHLTSFVGDRQFRLSLDLVSQLDQSVMVSFSPGALYASKGLKTLKPILSRSYILFINQDEIEQITGQDFTAGAKTCLEEGCRIVAVTLGKGVSWRNVTATSYIRDAESEYIVEATNQKAGSVLDTTGAGDAFTAGFLYGLLKGSRLKESGRLGDIVARFSTAKVGARKGLPALKQLSQRYRELYHQEL